MVERKVGMYWSRNESCLEFSSFIQLYIIVQIHHYVSEGSKLQIIVSLLFKKLVHKRNIFQFYGWSVCFL